MFDKEYIDKEYIIEELKKYRYAHRGLHDKPTIPENSLAAFKRAVDNGFGMELDVHLTLDNKLVVTHDSNLRRVTTVRADHKAVTPDNMEFPTEVTIGCERAVEEMTLEEIQSYPLEESDERVPELSDVLKLVQGRTPIIVELKPRGGNHKALADKTVEVLKDYDGVFCVESFNSFAVLYLARQYPEIVRGQLASNLTRDAREKKPDDPRESFKTSAFTTWMVRDMRMNILSKPDFAAYNFRDRRNKHFRNFDGLKVIWTIRNALDLELSERLGAICIFENFIPDSPEPKR